MSVLEGESPDSGRVLRERWERGEGIISSPWFANTGRFHIRFSGLEPQILGQEESEKR